MRLRDKLVFYVLFALLVVTLAIYGWCNPHLSTFIIGFCELALPISFYRASKTLEESDRQISAQFVFVLAEISLIASLLTTLEVAPLTLLLDPGALQSDGKPYGPPSTIVAKVYSLFDVMSIVGTVATFGLVAMGAVIPEETRQIDEKRNRSKERVLLVDQFIGLSNKLLRTKIADNRFEEVRLEQRRVWLLLRNMFGADDTGYKLDALALRLDALFKSRDPAWPELRHETLIEIENELSALVRDGR